MFKLKRNIFFNLLGQGLVLILGFVSFKYIYAGLGEDALGIIYFSLMLSTLFVSSLDMGLSKTTIREIAAHNESEPDYIIQLTQTFSFLYWLVYTVITIVFVAILPFIIDSWITLTTMDDETAYYVLLIIGISSLLAIPKAFLTSICVGLQRMDVNNSIDIVVSIIQQAGMVILLVNEKDIVVIAYWMGITNVLRILIYFTFVVRLLSIESMLPLFSMIVISRIKNYTKNMMWISLVLVIHKQLDKVLISKLLPIGVLGIYSFMFTSIGKTSMVTGAVAQAVFPLFSELGNGGKYQELVKKFHILQDFLVYFTAPIFASVIYFSLPLFTYLLDKEKAISLQIPIILLSISFYLSAILRLSRIYMFAINKSEKILRADVLSLFIVIPVTVTLVYSLGVNGAALSWVIFYGVLILLILPCVYRHEFNKSSYFWVRDVVIAFVLLCAVYIPAWIISETYYANNIIVLTFSYIIASIVYGVLALNFTGSDLQMKIMEYCPRIRRLIVGSGL